MVDVKSIFLFSSKGLEHPLSPKDLTNFMKKELTFGGRVFLGQLYFTTDFHKSYGEVPVLKWPDAKHIDDKVHTIQKKGPRIGLGAHVRRL